MMRVLVLTETAGERPHVRPTVTDRIVATLSRANIPHALVPPGRLLWELLIEGRVGLLVVDAESVDGSIPDVFTELRRRVLTSSGIEVIVFGETLAKHESASLFASGVSNWFPAERVGVLHQYWHWAQCSSAMTFAGDVVWSKLMQLEEWAQGPLGWLEIADGTVSVRLIVGNGRLGMAEVADFDSTFSQAVRHAVRGRLAPKLRAPAAAATAEEWREELIAQGCWERVVVRDAVEQRLRRTLRWFTSTGVTQVRFHELHGDVEPDLLWQVDDLCEDLDSPRHSFTRLVFEQQSALVANDTAIADVS